MRKWTVLAWAALGLAGLAALFARRGPRLPPDAELTIARIRAGPVTGVVNGEPGYAQSGDVRIWYESLPPVGAQKGVILLNIALGASSLYWPPTFLRVLTAAGYRVIRYDQQGTGASSWMTDWSRDHAYSLIDMATMRSPSSTSLASTALTSSGSPSEGSLPKRSRSATPSGSAR